MRKGLSRQRVTGIPADTALAIFDVVISRVRHATWDVAATRVRLIEAVVDGFIEIGDAKRIITAARRPQLIMASAAGIDRIKHRWNLHRTRIDGRDAGASDGDPSCEEKRP
jgi:hypothetical protein